MKVIGYSYHAVMHEHRSQEDVIDLFVFESPQERVKFLGGNPVGQRIASIHPATDADAQRIYNNCCRMDGDWGRINNLRELLL
jgi:hypothetical protein